ncbi:MAG: hypothetical protein HXX18_10550 [Bacteroidetes bacterium]|nr:hypothetical protein [Bacteroidota bacterium]
MDKILTFKDLKTKELITNFTLGIIINIISSLIIGAFTVEKFLITDIRINGFIYLGFLIILISLIIYKVIRVEILKNKIKQEIINNKEIYEKNYRKSPVINKEHEKESMFLILSDAYCFLTVKKLKKYINESY